MTRVGTGLEFKISYGTPTHTPTPIHTHPHAYAHTQFEHNVPIRYYMRGLDIITSCHG